MHPRALLLTAIAPAFLGWGCYDVGPEQAELERARARWAAVGPSSYTYGLERICFCPPVGPARITVEAGEVVSVEWLEPSPEWSQPQAEWYPSVDGLFQLIDAALAQRAHSVQVTYDPTNGVPLELYIDYSEQIADEELGMRVTEPVTPLP